MYRIKSGSTHGLADVEAFIAVLNNPGAHPVRQLHDFFEADAEVTLARAPGRLDVMGGIADYSGSLVLELPLAEATVVAVQRDRRRIISILSLSATKGEEARSFSMSLDEFEERGEPIDYEAARARFQVALPGEAPQLWAAYVAGIFLALMRERKVRFAEGSRILIHSAVPEGKGVSSSAALEVAVMQAIASAFEITLAPQELAVLCQKVENLIAGAPCGVMDQMTAACGQAHRLLALSCQPAQLEKTPPSPAGASFWGLDSGIRHSVSGADYGSVRIAAFMGYRIIADLAGLKASRLPGSELVKVDDEKWGGYLANMTPSEFEQVYASRLPEGIIGSEFLRHYQGTTDAVTRVDPGRTYAVRVATAHPIYENFRVRAYADLLLGALSESRLKLLGELMYQSHASYSACGLGSSGTDLLVQLVREAGPRNGLYGAKITGGGSGGTVAVLGRSDAGEAIVQVADQYAAATGHQPYIFAGSSPGAACFGQIRLEKTKREI